MAKRKNDYESYDYDFDKVTLSLGDIELFGATGAVVLEVIRMNQPIASPDLDMLLACCLSVDTVHKAVQSLCDKGRVVFYHVPSDPLVRFMLNPEYKRPPINIAKENEYPEETDNVEDKT